MMSFMYTLFLCSSIVQLVLACGSLNKNILGGKYEFIDLAFSVDSKIVGNNYDGNSSTWPSDERATAPQGGGTHIVAPAEYTVRGANIGEIPEEKLVVQLIFLNISSKVKDNSSFMLRMNDLENLLNNDMLHQLSSWPSLVVFAFGWSKYYRDNKTYYGNGTFSYPAIGHDITDWLTKNKYTKKVVGVGTDLPLLDGGLSIVSAVDKTLAKAGMYVIESLNLTVSLPGDKCITVVSPFKIAAASRVPTSVVAICPKHSVQKSTANTEHDHTSSKDRKKQVGGQRSKRHTFEHHMHEHEHHMDEHEHHMDEHEHDTKHDTEREHRHDAEHEHEHDTKHDTEREHEHDTEHKHEHDTKHEHKHDTEREHEHDTKHENEHDTEHKSEHDTEHKSEHRSKRHACKNRGHYEHTMHEHNDTEEQVNTEYHVKEQEHEHTCHKCGHHSQKHEEKKKKESNGQDNSDKKDKDKKDNTQSSGKGDKTDQQGNNKTKETIPNGSGNKESSSTGNLPQQVIDGIQSIKNKLKIPG